MKTFQEIAAYINNSKTGSIASIQTDHVSVEVPGLMSIPGTNRCAHFYSTEKIYNMQGAIRLILSMD